MRKAFIIGTGVAVVVIAGGVFYVSQREPLWANPDDRELVALGGTVYAGHCAACHGQNLEGQPNWRAPLPTGGLPAPPHDASGHTWHHPDALLFDYTKKGGQAMAPASFKSHMPGFADKLSDREIYAVLAYIKSRWPTSIRQRQARLNQAER